MSFGEASPELAMFIPLKGGSGRGSSISGGGGDTINITFRIDGNDIVNSREFKRQIKRDAGTSRYTIGA